MAQFEESYTCQIKLRLTQDEFRKSIIDPDWAIIVDEITPFIKKTKDLEKKWQKLFLNI